MQLDGLNWQLGVANVGAAWHFVWVGFDAELASDTHTILSKFLTMASTHVITVLRCHQKLPAERWSVYS